MSLYYIETKNGRKSVYGAVTVDDATGREIAKRTVEIPLLTVMDDGKKDIVLYDDEMNPIPEAFHFINDPDENAPITTKRQRAFALRLLYVFLALSGHTLQKMDRKVIGELVAFLRGIGGGIGASMITTRCADTVNEYLSVYRSFLRKEEIECPALMNSRAWKVSSYWDGAETKTSVKIYESNVKSYSRNDQTAPRYIHPDVYRKIFLLASEKEDVLMMLILRLMYCYGLRLGEVLGLTIEDITTRRRNYKDIPTMIIRNRATDRRDAFAKRKPHVTDKRLYKDSDFKKASDEIVLSQEMYRYLLNYIDSEHPKAEETWPENYRQGMADIVEPERGRTFNHYLFLGTNGKPVVAKTFGEHLKAYFREAGIPVDKGKKSEGLAHRFRHGFAMWHVRFSPHPVNLIQLQKMMRHRSIESTQKYFRPTEEDELETKTAFEKELYDMMPELRDGLAMFYREDEPWSPDET